MEKSHEKTTDLTADEYYESLLKDAPLRPFKGISQEQSDVTKSEWFQWKLLEEGKRFVNQYYFSVILAHYTSYLWLLLFKPVTAVMLSTGKFHGVGIRERSLATLLGLTRCYEGDFLNKGSIAAQGLRNASRQHASAALRFPFRTGPVQTEMSHDTENLFKILKTELDKIELQAKPAETYTGDKPRVAISQYTMVIVQFCLIGFVVLMPECFGILETEGIDGFVHNHAIIGRMLGIEDRHNIGLHYLVMGKEAGRRSFRRIFNSIFVPQLKDIEPTALNQWVNFFTNFRQFLLGLRLKPFIYLMIFQNTFKCDAQKLKQSMDLVDKAGVSALRFCTYTIASFSLGRSFLNALTRFAFFLAWKIYLE